MRQRRNILRFFMANLLGTLLSHRVHVTATEGDKQRIHGGEDANPHEFPSYASLRSGSGARICGASVINQDWVVTAAHCVSAFGPPHLRQLTVIAGQTSTSDEVKQIVNVTRIIFHPKFR